MYNTTQDTALFSGRLVFPWLQFLLFTVITGSLLASGGRSNETTDQIFLLLRANAATPSAPPPYRVVNHTDGLYQAEYGFLNFNNDRLALTFALPESDLTDYLQGYGYFEQELEDLNLWQQQALDDAYNYAVKNRLGQNDLNQMGEKIQQEYAEKFETFLNERGFRFLDENLLVADIPSIVSRNVRKLQPVALDLARIAEERGYGAYEIVSAALALVQTSLAYEEIPLDVAGRQTGGVAPPLEALAQGKGDCDSKTALLASILLNWEQIRLVGVGVPGHYLMGVMRQPGKGEAYVEYEGNPYVLIEPAGPAWLPPGHVGPTTIELLNSGNALMLEPFDVM
ncbi:MAG: hypothetical protein C0621_02120 [Desulfuromonas sp.]|mgnify:CR=1 FL=1|nr:MAG: hypothetical protein C0621_02120 [Desulfuromonas sp.]